MVPGRSLSGKTGGRSIAPVASTTCRARIRQSRRPRSAASVSPSRPSYSTPAKVNLIACPSSRVPLELEPAAAAVRVHPALPKETVWVVAHEQVLRPLLVGGRRRFGRIDDLRLPAVRELDLVALAAPGTANEQHQCETPAAPCPSISAPVTNRSSEKGAFSSCGAP